MAKLTIEDLIKKREDCEKRKEKKYIEIHSEFLGGEIEFHSVEKGDILDFRDRAKSDPQKAVLNFIYMSSDDLRNKELLKAYGRDKREQYKIVEDLFGKESEQEKVLEILFELNGLGETNPEQIYVKEVEKIKN
jgi:hypothetical protein